MMTRKLAVALVAAAGIALQAAFLHAAVVAPLGSALSDLRAGTPAATFEESIEVVAKAPPAPADPNAKRT
jgi:hypothetical protein